MFLYDKGKKVLNGAVWFYILHFNKIYRTYHFVMVPLNLTRLNCLQHFYFVHLFNLYYEIIFSFWNCIDIIIVLLYIYITNR